MSYIIIDNFLSLDDHLKIKTEMMDTKNFPWYYCPTVAYKDVEEDSFYFSHTFYDTPYVKSNFFELLLPLIAKVDAKSLIRVKGNLYTNMGKWIGNGMHVDYDYQHKGAVYYVNTNNGYTVLEDGTKIDSIANRIVFFDSSKPHHSTHCTDEKVRVNINMNYF